MGEIKLIRFPNTFRIEFSQKEFVRNKGHYSLSNIEKEKKEKGRIRNWRLIFKKKLPYAAHRAEVRSANSH